MLGFKTLEERWPELVRDIETGTLCPSLDIPLDVREQIQAGSHIFHAFSITFKADIFQIVLAHCSLSFNLELKQTLYENLGAKIS